MRKKIVILDLDGTLLSDNKEIDYATLSWLKKYMDAGGQIALASGRRYEDAEIYVKQLFVDQSRSGYVICCDGCYIYDSDGNLLHTSALLCGDELEFIYSTAKAEQCDFRFYSQESDYAVFRMVNLIKNILKSAFIGKYEGGRIVHRVKSRSLINYSNIEKVVLEKQKGTFSKKCCAELKDQFNFHKMSNRRIEIQKRGINKSYAVGQLLKMKGLSWEDVIFFGNDANDHCMLGKGCTVVAMGNADDFMKKEADYLTLTNNEQGVMKALEELIVTWGGSKNG